MHNYPIIKYLSKSWGGWQVVMVVVVLKRTMVLSRIIIKFINLFVKTKQVTHLLWCQFQKENLLKNKIKTENVLMKGI